MRVLFYYRGVESLGVGYLMSMLKENGHEIDLIFDPGFDDNLYLKAPFLLMQHVARHMVERGGGGRIVNVSPPLRCRRGPRR